MKILILKLNAESLRQLNFGLTPGEKIKAAKALTKSEHKQKIELLKKRMKNEGFMDHAIDIVATELRDSFEKYPEFKSLIRRR